MILFGAGVGYKALLETMNPAHLTPYGAYSTVALGFLLMLAGLGHFRAPHKAFLISIPLLMMLQLQIYCIALFYDVKKVSLFLATFLIASVLILFLSYVGYHKRQAPAPSAQE